jgi:glycosyltransferase involved in cell wall biosynthesis
MGERARERAASFTTERTMRAVYEIVKGAGSAKRQAADVLLAARWPVGGIRTHLGYNYPAIVAAGHRCTAVVPNDGSLPALRDTLEGARVVPVSRNGRDYPMWRTLRPLVASGRFALVHAHGLTAAAHASLACLGQQVPLLVTLHEPLRASQFAGLVGTLKRWLLGRALSRSTAIITVTEDSRANLLRHFPNLRKHTSRIHTIPNGIDTTHYEMPSLDEGSLLREELKLDDRTFLIGYLGRFMPEKGFSLLLDAVERLTRFGGVPAFHLVAFGTGDYRREYTRRIEESGLKGHVSLHDFVPEVRPVLDQLDLVVVPSLWEASSLVSMEAMCAGVPVLGSDCPGLREVLRNTPSRTFQTGLVAGLETALRQALTDPWFDDAAAFAPLARERFDNRRSARQLVELYARLMGEPCLTEGDVNFFSHPAGRETCSNEAR